MAKQVEDAQLSMHIGGEWVGSESGDTFERISPATGETLATLPKADREDARAAIDAANQARSRMASMPVFERAALCHAVADVLQSRHEAMAEELSLEQGKTYREACEEILFAAELYRDAGENIKRLETSIVPSVDPESVSSPPPTPRRGGGDHALEFSRRHTQRVPVGRPGHRQHGGVEICPHFLHHRRAVGGVLPRGGRPRGCGQPALRWSRGGDEMVANPGTHAVGLTGSRRWATPWRSEQAPNPPSWS